jgi:lipopolysaccharide transport protein LptA
MPDLLSKLPGKAPAPAASAPRQASPISITADRLTYSDTKHQGTYLGHVVLTSAQARLTAGRLQVDLAPSASKTASAGPAVLQRVTASEDVKITQPGREAKAQTVVYDMAENRITMRGGPPSIYDAEHGYLTGETLTFFPSNDTIRVESEPGKRTFGEYRVKH